jgi:hypothetical protein
MIVGKPGPVQQTLEPGEKSCAGLTSSSYLAAPGTPSQEKKGSCTSASARRSPTVVAVVVGHSQVKEATAEGAPR